ncbi:DUF6049 family protein [Leucobacter allii]|uniref:DUF6049 family protein n=1 Tax=Leucobacter allii TaxID=2932247 RepID=A0ABY4FLF3_9MICO|nr:DUF6049 family protein [Leucobacter allii]UOQ57075.1 DUF6049 family protein [Leucobacter allii]
MAGSRADRARGARRRGRRGDRGRCGAHGARRRGAGSRAAARHGVDRRRGPRAQRGGEELPAGTLELRLGTAPLAGPDPGETAEPDGEAAGALIAEVPLPATGPGAEQEQTVSVPRDQLPLGALPEAGVYALRAELVPGEQAGRAATLRASSAVVWRDAAAAADPVVLPLSVIVPLVLPADIRTLPTRTQLEELVPRWEALLAAARAREATLAIDPRVIAGIRAYGDDAPVAAQRFLAALERSPLPDFLLQFADADPAAQADLGFTTLLEPTNLDFVTRFGAFDEPQQGGTDAESGDAANPGDGADATTAGDDDPDAADGAPAGAEAGADRTGGAGGGSGSAGSEAADADAGAEGDDPAADFPFPDIASLTAWDETEPAGWPAEGEADAATLALLDDAGIDTVVLDSGVVAADDGPVVELATGGTAIVTDTGLAGAARAALGAAAPAERSAGLAELAARTAFAAANGDAAVLGLDRGAVGDAEDPAAILDALAGFDWVRATPIAEQRTGTGALAVPAADAASAGESDAADPATGPATDADGTTSATTEAAEAATDAADERRELLGAAVGRESSVSELGAVLAHPAYLSGYQRSRLLELFATRHAGPGFAEVADRFRLRDAELLEGVQAISTEHTQLVGASTRVPVQLRNSLPFDAVVSVEAAPASAALAVAERRFPEVAVPAEANQTVLVPVRSRISSAESGLVVSVSSTGGELTVFTGTLPITIRASFEVIAMWTLGVLAALLLGFGIWRSVRRRRRTGRGPAASEGAGDPGSAE